LEPQTAEFPTDDPLCSCTPSISESQIAATTLASVIEELQNIWGDALLHAGAIISGSGSISSVLEPQTAEFPTDDRICRCTPSVSESQTTEIHTVSPALSNDRSTALFDGSERLPATEPFNQTLEPFLMTCTYCMCDAPFYRAIQTWDSFTKRDLLKIYNYRHPCHRMSRHDKHPRMARSDKYNTVAVCPLTNRLTRTLMNTALFPVLCLALHTSSPTTPAAPT
jgi:hypothetical protein